MSLQLSQHCLGCGKDVASSVGTSLNSQVNALLRGKQPRHPQYFSGSPSLTQELESAILHVTSRKGGML